MGHDYWLRQTSEEPLFPELLWSRPENKRHAGKLLIIGGNSFGFSAVGEAYMAATKAGIGTARVLLPSAIRKVVGHVLEHAEFATSNPSGSFSKEALGELLEQASWADCVLLAGDFGRNSETAVLLEQFTQKYTGKLTITKDALDYFLSNAQLVFGRPNTTLVMSMGQLQKFGKSLHLSSPITSSMDLMQLVEILHAVTKQYSVTMLAKHFNNILAAQNGSVSTTALQKDKPVWRIETAATASVWWLQNPTEPFKSITAAVTTF